MSQFRVSGHIQVIADAAGPFTFDEAKCLTAMGAEALSQGDCQVNFTTYIEAPDQDEAEHLVHSHILHCLPGRQIAGSSWRAEAYPPAPPPPPPPPSEPSAPSIPRYQKDTVTDQEAAEMAHQRAQSEIGALKAELRDRQQRLEQTSQSLVASTETVERLSNDLELARERIAELEGGPERDQVLAGQGVRIHELEEQISEGAARTSITVERELGDMLRAANARVADLEAEKIRLNSEIAAAEAGWTDFRNKWVEAQDQLGGLQFVEVPELRTRIEEQDRSIEQLHALEAELRRDLKSSRDSNDALKAELRNREDEILRLRSECSWRSAGHLLERAERAEQAVENLKAAAETQAARVREVEDRWFQERQRAVEAEDGEAERQREVNRLNNSVQSGLARERAAGEREASLRNQLRDAQAEVERWRRQWALQQAITPAQHDSAVIETLEEYDQGAEETKDDATISVLLDQVLDTLAPATKSLAKDDTEPPEVEVMSLAQLTEEVRKMLGLLDEVARNMPVGFLKKWADIQDWRRLTDGRLEGVNGHLNHLERRVTLDDQVQPRPEPADDVRPPVER